MNCFFAINYEYNIRNNLVGITAGRPGADPNYIFDANTIDGLGRLKNAVETITYPSQANRSHTSIYGYDMRSSLINAHITDVNDSEWWLFNFYRKDGNIYVKYEGNDLPSMYPKTYSYDTTPGNGNPYDSDIMTEAGSDDLYWDENGRLIETPTIDFEYNWDGKLRNAVVDSDSIDLKYDPMGNRVQKSSSAQGNQRYIVDIAGRLPTILLEIDPTDMSVKKSYMYANSQILTGYDGDSAQRYFYTHDRLGSVRLVVDDDGKVKNSYTYDPWGKDFGTECTETVYNPFKFTGQWWDSEIGQYYLRARQYDPILMRLTSYDPVKGKFNRPLTLHPYLYCGNDSINKVDLDGRIAIVIGGTNDLDNIEPKPHNEHVKGHKEKGDFSKWARRRKR